MRLNWSISTIALGAGAALIVMLATAFVTVLAMAGRQSPPNLTGRVQFGADGCQGFVIDHKTGFIRKDQPIACPEPAKEAKREAAKAVSPVNPATEGTGHRYSSGGRLDAVRDSFNKR
jgi:hypothetical protein